jgi:hypothetical protein
MTQRETNIRTIKLRGVPISISREKGSLIIWGKPEYRGKTVEIDAIHDYKIRASANFVKFNIGKKEYYVAIFNRVEPFEYIIRAFYADHTLTSITITSNYVTQIDWEE